MNKLSSVYLVRGTLKLEGLEVYEILHTEWSFETKQPRHLVREIESKTLSHVTISRITEI